MKVFVSGGSGYIGTELVRRLARRQDVEEIVVYDNLSRGNHNFLLLCEGEPFTNVRFVRGDVLDSRRLRMVLRGIDAVYHLAARVSTPFSDESAHLFEQVNHWGTAELVSAVEESDVGRFVFTSSAAVYGSAESPVNIDHPPNPRTYYGAAKLRAEEQVARLDDIMRTYVVRCANVYGYSKSMRFDAVVNRFMLAAHVGEAMQVQGGGRQVRSFVNVANVAACLEALLDSDLPTATYDLVDRNLSILELTDAVRALYPAAETLFVSQHVEPRHLRVEVKGALGSLLGVEPGDLQTELGELAARFATAPR